MTEGINRLSFDKYRPMALAAEALQKGNTQKAVGALEILMQNFGVKTDESKLLAMQLAKDSQTTIENYMEGYQQLHKKTMKEVANEIHGNFLKEKLGDQYGEFQKDVEKYSGMTYGDLSNKAQRVMEFQEMKTATDEEKKKEMEKFKQYENVYLALTSAESYELKKIESTIGDNSVNNTFENIKNSYKKRQEKSEKKK